MKIVYIIGGIAAVAGIAFGINYMLKKQKTGIESIDKINQSVSVQINGVLTDYKILPKGTTELAGGYSLVFNPESVNLMKDGEKVDRMAISA